jgi:hypothetical protein
MKMDTQQADVKKTPKPIQNGSNGAANKTTPKAVKPKVDAKVKGDDTPAADFSGAIYEALVGVFGNKNPTQMFSLCWPGTVISYDDLGWEDEDGIMGAIPPEKYIRMSRLLDIYVPPAPITQPDGTRVSDRYKQAISQLAPKMNKHLAELQKILRDRINKTVTVEVNGKERDIKIVDYFYLLFGKWTKSKKIWSTKQQEAVERYENKYPGEPNEQYRAYIEWYERNADSWIDEINAAYYELIAQFPLTQWEDAISILDTKDDGNLNAAKELLRHAEIPVPPKEGFSYFPTNSIPSNWPKQIKPTTGFIDFLSDPELQKSVLETALAKLQTEITTWRAIVPQIDDESIVDLANELNAKSKAYRQKQAELRDTYTENAVTAVEIFIDLYASKGQTLSEESDTATQDKVAGEVSNLTDSLTASNGKANKGAMDWEGVKKAAKDIGDGQDKLNAGQLAVVDAGMDLANAAQTFLTSKGESSKFQWIESYIIQLQTCCDNAKEQLKNFASSSNQYHNYLDTATVANPTDNPNFAPDFGNNAFPEAIADRDASTWSEIKVTIDKTQMESTRSLSTFFKQSDWGVNFFLGSAGGTSMESGTDFAEDFMSESTKIEMGFLATKVTIDRAWMKPEVFQNTGNMFRVMDKPLSPKTAVNVSAISKFDNEKELLKLINDNSFPAYPVSFIVVKDFCVKLNLTASQTSRARDTWDSKKTSSGGFFCFSVSNTTAETTDNESMSSYAMGGQMILRSPSPQIIAYFNQMLPPDNSTVLDENTVKEIGSAIGFISDLQTALNSDALPPTVTPKKS